MRNRDSYIRILVILGGMVAALIAQSPESRGCAIVSPNDADPVTMLHENVIIAWNPARKVEHFIRQAKFHAKTKDFGFLVPTPSVPELAEADVGGYDRLRAATQPKHVEKRQLKLHATLFEFIRLQRFDSIFTNVDSSLPTASPDVEVINEQTVAGFKASVLRANDPDALAGWLEENGYEFTPETVEWVGPYIEKGWLITAFKYEKESGDSLNQLKTKAIRMSFSTERPFFPYREPPQAQTAKSASGRALNVYMVAPFRMGGFLEESKLDWSSDARTGYAASLDNVENLLAGVIPAAGLQGSQWLTVFHDFSMQRPTGEDLYFKASADQMQIVPAPIVTYGSPRNIPLCLDVAIGLLLVRGLRNAIRRIGAQGAVPAAARGK